MVDTSNNGNNTQRASSLSDSSANVIQKECEKFNNSNILEGMTSISAAIQGIRAGVNARVLQTVFVDRQKLKSKAREIGFLRAVSGELNFEIEIVDEEWIDRMTVGSTHGGIIAKCSDRPLPSLADEFSNPATFGNPNGFYVLPEGIEDPYNFGYALRSLYAAGVTGIILSERNWMGAAGVVSRASAGASEMLDMFIASGEDAVEAFRSLNYKIICAGIRNSVSIYDADMKKPIFLIIGGEKRGISSSVLQKADQIVRIDYDSKFRGSLSAASSSAIIGFEIMHQNKIM